MYVPWISRQRDPWPSMTGRMFVVLTDLRAAKRAGYAFQELAAHGRTLRALIERDWVFESTGLDGIRYTITGRGEKALTAYEKPLRRADGLCPACGKHPKHMRASGKLDGYCADCLRRSNKRKRTLRIDRRPGSLCSHCHERPRKVNPNGSVITYCAECNRELKREDKRRRQRELFEAVRAGAPVPTCSVCEKQPCHVTDHCVRDKCLECWRAYMNDYNDRRRPNSRPAKARGRQEAQKTRSSEALR